MEIHGLMTVSFAIQTSDKRQAEQAEAKHELAQSRAKKPLGLITLFELSSNENYLS